MRIRRRDGCSHIDSDLQAAVGGRDRKTAAAVHVHMLAGLVARGGHLPVVAILVERRMIPVGARAMVMRGVAVKPVVPVRMGVKGVHDRRIAAQAAGAYRDRNQENAQSLASQLAHALRNTQRFSRGQVN
jgi:hypothetical protein